MFLLNSNLKLIIWVHFTNCGETVVRVKAGIVLKWEIEWKLKENVIERVQGFLFYRRIGRVPEQMPTLLRRTAELMHEWLLSNRLSLSLRREDGEKALADVGGCVRLWHSFILNANKWTLFKKLSFEILSLNLKFDHIRLYRHNLFRIEGQVVESLIHHTGQINWSTLTLFRASYRPQLVSELLPFSYLIRQTYHVCSIEIMHGELISLEFVSDSFRKLTASNIWLANDSIRKVKEREWESGLHI